MSNKTKLCSKPCDKSGDGFNAILSIICSSICGKPDATECVDNRVDTPQSAYIVE